MIIPSANKVLKSLIALLIVSVLSACASATEALPTETPVANTSTPAATSPPADTPTPEATSTPTLAPLIYPPPRGYHSMAYDSESDVIILQGGSPNVYQNHDDIWTYQTSTNTWTQMASFVPETGTLAYDTESDRVLNYSFFKFGPERELTPLGKLLAYDSSIDTWTQIDRPGIPFGQVGARMAYDSESDRIILFGGMSVETGAFFDETWSYDFNTNTGAKMNPEVSPPGRNYQAMAYHPTIDRVVIFGGDVLGHPGNDTWEYDFNTDSWELIDTSNAPPSRDYSSMVYAASLDRIVLFGGQLVTGRAGNDMWVYDHDKKTWIELTPETVPGERYLHAMTYDSAADKIVLFGGRPNKDAFTDETWIYDPQTNEWIDMTPGH